MASKLSKLKLLAVACFSLSLPIETTEAGRRTGTWRYWGPGWGYAYPGYYGGGWGYPGYYGYYRRRSNAGAAFAAGLVGGVALGAIIASSNRAYSRCYVAPRRIASASGSYYYGRVRVCR